MVEEETQKAIDRLEITNDQVHSALVELLIVVQELQKKVEDLEKWYDGKFNTEK